MTTKRLIYLLLLLHISVLGLDRAFSAERKIKKDTGVIPKSLSLYLRDHFPNLSILPKDRAEKDLLKYFASERIKQPSPFICPGDFNGDGLRDFVLLLRDKTDGRIKLVAFHQKPKQNYVHFVLDEIGSFGPHPIDVYLVCEKPGKKMALDGSIFEIKHDGFTEAIFDKASSSLFYFDIQNNQYKEVVTED